MVRMVVLLTFRTPNDNGGFDRERDAQIMEGEDNIEDASACPRFSVVWDYIGPNRQRIRVFVDGDLRLLRDANFINEVFGGETDVLIGYTGATGGSFNEQAFCLPTGFDPPVGVDDFQLIEPGEATVMDVVANDIAASSHPDLWATGITVSPQNGTASLMGDQKRIRYRPDAGFVGSDRLEYRVCNDPNEDRCYAECTTAVLTIDVGCPSDNLLQLEKFSDNAACEVSLSSGSVGARVVVLEDVNYEEDFSSSSTGAVSGSRVQSDGEETLWEFREVVAPTVGVGDVRGVESFFEYCHLEVSMSLISIFM